MPKFVKVTADNEVSVVELPSEVANDTDRYFPKVYDMIGNGCSFIEIVYPAKLYSDWGFSDTAISLMVDDEGAMKAGRKRNPLGSFLYGESEHGSSLYGTIIFVESHDEYDGDFELTTKVGLSEDNLKKLTSNITEFFKARGEKFTIELSE